LPGGKVGSFKPIGEGQKSGQMRLEIPNYNHEPIDCYHNVSETSWGLTWRDKTYKKCIPKLHTENWPSSIQGPPSGAMKLITLLKKNPTLPYIVNAM